MIVKPTPAPADPSKVCRTCGHHDPNLHICAANDTFIFTDVAQTHSCSDWEPKKEHEDMLLEICKMQQGKQPVFGGTSLSELAAKQKKQEEQLPPSACCFNCEHRDKMSLKCKLNISDAVLTVMRSQHESCGSWEPEQFYGVHLRVVDPEEDKKQKEELVQKCLVAKEKGYRRGYMVAELHMMCDAASQLLPDRKPQWERLRNTLEDALKALWARNDQDKKENKQ